MTSRPRHFSKPHASTLAHTKRNCTLYWSVCAIDHSPMSLLLNSDWIITLPVRTPENLKRMMARPRHFFKSSIGTSAPESPMLPCCLHHSLTKQSVTAAHSTIFFLLSLHDFFTTLNGPVQPFTCHPGWRSGLQSYNQHHSSFSSTFHRRFCCSLPLSQVSHHLQPS